MQVKKTLRSFLGAAEREQMMCKRWIRSLKAKKATQTAKGVESQFLIFEAVVDNMEFIDAETAVSAPSQGTQRWKLRPPKSRTESDMQ